LRLSDPDPDARLSVAAWVKATDVTNVRAPIALDALHSVWPIASADGIICINMIHISPWEATVGLIKGDQSLRDRNPKWGLRDLEAVAATAQTLGISGPVITEMPANNLSAVFRRM
jgi:hypothetical protein